MSSISKFNPNNPGNAESLGERELLLLAQLRSDVDKMELMSPPDSCWQNIQQQIDRGENRNGRFSVSYWFGGIAASVLFVVFGTILHNQYRIQEELASLRTANQLLEFELKQVSSSSETASGVFTQVLLTEQQMELATSDKELLRLLKQRQQAIQALLEMKNHGNSRDVISL